MDRGYPLSLIEQVTPKNYMNVSVNQYKKAKSTRCLHLIMLYNNGNTELFDVMPNIRVLDGQLRPIIFLVEMY